MGTRIGTWMAVAGVLAVAVARAEQTAGTSLRVETTVVRATVYREGAQVTRQGTLTLDEGTATVTLPGLPVTADPGSLRVTLAGPRGSLMHHVQLRTVLGAEAAEKRTRELRRRIRGLEDRRAVIQDRITARNYELDVLRGTRPHHKKPDAEKARDWKDLTTGAETVGTRIHALLAQNREDQVLIRGLDEEIAGHHRQIALSGSLARDTTALDIELTAAARGEVTFTVSYIVREASWRAGYDLALDAQSATASLDVALTAEVTQRTGEDWTGTALTVSTERPAHLAAPVPPKNDYRVEYRKRKAVRLEMSEDGRSSAAPSAAPRDEDEPIRFQGAKVIAGEYATRYKVAQPVVIKSGADHRRVALVDLRLPCRAGVVIVPAAAPTAILTASAKVTGDLPLIAGPARLYRDGEYVGTATLEARMPGDELRVPFGTDPAVRITRKTLANGKTEGWKWFGVSRRWRWETSLKSGHGSRWTVEVREQLPQSDDPDVRITEGDLSAGLLEDDPEQPGLKRWQIDLEPGKTRKIVFEYVIRAKKGVAVPHAG